MKTRTNIAAIVALHLVAVGCQSHESSDPTGATTDWDTNFTFVAGIDEAQQKLWKAEENAEDWRRLFYTNVKDFQGATRSGFAAPARVTNTPTSLHPSGTLVTMITPTTGVDWSKPIGFALVDCDNKVTMLDGRAAPLEAIISWDAKLGCLRVRVAP